MELLSFYARLNPIFCLTIAISLMYLHIYFNGEDEGLYHEIKGIHKNLDTCGMAQVVGFVISHFFEGVREYDSIGAFVRVLETDNDNW